MSDLQLPGFELIEKIGEGGMGHVWKARQISLDRLVAIKLLPPRFVNDPESVRQIMQEARIAAKLKHPGIVQVYDASEQNGVCFFVMEYVDGYTVGQWVARKKVLQSKDALIVVEAVASALKYAWHASELIHCDLKPENIMVDKDGTIKVADLGLSLTRDSQTSLQSDEIAGTPGYISPEQVTGQKKLDCRTDIYALGCCLYHMVTGHRPFQELSDSQAMEAQVTSTIPDPRDWVPSVPGPVCALIERMLVKDCDLRLKDWRAVLSEVRRVQNGMAPSGPAPAPGASTMCRRSVPVSTGGAETNGAATKTSSWSPWPFIAVIVVAVLAAIYVMTSRNRAPVRDVDLPSTPQPAGLTNTTGVKSPVRSVNSAQLEAKAAADRARAASIARVTAQIREKVSALVADGGLEEAIRWLDSYTGQYENETFHDRNMLAGELRKKLDEQDSAKHADSDWQALLEEMSGAILTGKFAVARQTAEANLNHAKFSAHQRDLTTIANILQGVSSINDRILETFSKDIGSSIVLPISRGQLEGRLVEIRDRKLMLKTLDGVSQIEVRWDDIAVAERQRRLALMDRPEAYLVRGVSLLLDGNNEDAATLLAKTGPVLGPILAGRVQVESDAAKQAVMAADEGLTAFSMVMKKAGLRYGLFDAQKWRELLESCRIPVARVPDVERDLDAYLVNHGTSQFAASNPELILAFREALGRSLTQPKDETVDVPVDESGSKIRDALLAANPGLEQGAINIEPGAEGGKAAMTITSTFIRDLSPLSDFKDLASLTLISPGAKSGSLDITPLTGINLKKLSISGYDISDPSRLKGMRLTNLLIPNVPLKTLTMLLGMPLVALDVRGSAISDLDVLRGMKLETLHVDNTRVASITPLAGMPLHELTLGNTSIRDITYLRGLPLERLDLSGTQVSDFSVLRSFRLTRLDVSRTPVRDLSFCVDMPLKELRVSGTTLPSLAPLAGKTLSKLTLGDAMIRDLSALKTVKVTALDMEGTKIPVSVMTTALSQCPCVELNLAGSSLDRVDFIRNHRSLKILNLSGTKITDLAPLAGLPLEFLDLTDVYLDDLTPLRTMTALRSLNTSMEIPAFRPLIRMMPALERINGKPVQTIIEQALTPMPRRMVEE